MKSLNNSVLAREYLSGLSGQELAKKYSCSKGTIYNRLDNANVPRRSVSEQNKIDWTKGKYANRYKMPARERFETHIKKLDNDCWKWVGEINKDTGYGHHITSNDATKKDHLAHRYSYELYVGKIPKGLTLDHLCRNRWCVNPEHLEITTLKENILRGVSQAAINARKTHCIRGHQLSGNNLYITPKDSRRQCKKCIAIRSYNYSRRKELSYP